jgi:hypothetical protein
MSISNEINQLRQLVEGFKDRIKQLEQHVNMPAPPKPGTPGTSTPVPPSTTTGGTVLPKAGMSATDTVALDLANDLHDFCNGSENGTTRAEILTRVAASTSAPAEQVALAKQIQKFFDRFQTADPAQVAKNTDPLELQRIDRIVRSAFQILTGAQSELNSQSTTAVAGH